MGLLSTDVQMTMLNSADRPITMEGSMDMSLSEQDDKLQSGFFIPYFCDLRAFNFVFGTQPTMFAGEPEPVAADQHGARHCRDVIAARHRDFDGTVAAPTPVDVQPVTFKRQYDCASPLLLQAMVNSDALSSLVVIKRKAAGTDHAGLVYLRVTFTDALLIGLDWRDSDRFVEETGTFIYREAMIEYRPQKPDGALGEVIAKSWKMRA